MFLFQIVPPDIWTTLVPLIISIATPFLVKCATDLVTKILPTLSGWGIVAIVVPIISGLATVITTQITNAGPVWYLQLFLGFAAVFVNELVKQFKQGPVMFVRK